MEHVSSRGTGDSHKPHATACMTGARSGNSVRKAEMATDVKQVRSIARRITIILPPGFSGVLPRGYTLEGGALRMLKIQPLMAIKHLYGLHTDWGTAEAAAFEKDLRDGWLIELSAYMRWQMREQPDELATFQKDLRQLHSELES